MDGGVLTSIFKKIMKQEKRNEASSMNKRNFSYVIKRWLLKNSKFLLKN